MKTKVVQHVERESEWEGESCESSESERVWEWLLSIDMKTKVVQHAESERLKEWVLTILQEQGTLSYTILIWWAVQYV